jgi:hypothetical protein
MADAPVPDRPNIHGNRVPVAAKCLKYVCFLGFQDNRMRHPNKRPQTCEITRYVWAYPEDDR